MTIEQRLERLERQNRWMKRVCAVAAIGALLALLIANQFVPSFGPPGDIRVRSLILVDQDKKPQFTIEASSSPADATPLQPGEAPSPEPMGFLQLRDEKGLVLFFSRWAGLVWPGKR